MQQAVVYVEDPTNPKSATRVVSARVHHRFDQMGGLKGTSFHTTEREEVKPKAIFLVEEVPKPMRNAVISVDLGEAYRLDHSMPPDGIQ